ncbi:MAG: hypothetical protein AAGI52_07345 [Bacteroidota bacterium]
MFRLLAPLALLFLATAAHAQTCPTGLVMEEAPMMCMHVDDACESQLSLNGQTCLPSVSLASNPACGADVAFGSNCLGWADESAPEAGAARAALAQYTEGRTASGDTPDLFPSAPIITDPADLPEGFGAYPAHLTPACMDGIDNDGDGATDYPEAGCTSPFDHEETPEAGEGDTFQAFDGQVRDGALQMASLQYCNAPENRERFAADKRAILNYWHRQALTNALVPDYDYLGTPQTGMDSLFSRMGDEGRTFSFSDRHPVDREWNGEVDFAFGWGRGQWLEVKVVCNFGGVTDIRSYGSLGARGAEGGDQRKSWGPFNPERYRMQVGDPDVRVTEFGRLNSSYLRSFRATPVFYGSAEVAYLTPDKRYIVLVNTRADSGGNAARMNTPDGWRMVNASVSIGPWNLCTAGELTEPAASLSCDENQGRAQISSPPPQSPYIK